MEAQASDMMVYRLYDCLNEDCCVPLGNWPTRFKLIRDRCFVLIWFAPAFQGRHCIETESFMSSCTQLNLKVPFPET